MRIKEVREAAAYMKTHEGGGTEVIANPTLSGDEEALTGLEVAGVKYRVDSGTTSQVSFSFHTQPVVPDGETEVEITDEEDLAMLEDFYTNTLNGAANPPLYVSKINDEYEDDGQTYHYINNETFNCSYVLDDISEERPYTIDCSLIQPSYSLETYELLGGNVHNVSLWRDGEGGWIYHEGFKVLQPE